MSDWLRRVRRGEPGPGLSYWQRGIAFALLGLVMGTFFDTVHIWTGTAEYHDTAKIPVLGVAWYVPIEFTVAGVVVGLVRPILDARWGSKRRPDLRSALGGLAFFSAVWGASGLLTPAFCPAGTPPDCAVTPNIAYLVTLLLVGAAGWYVFDRTAEGVLVALLTAAIGVGIELYLILYDKTYRYLHPEPGHSVPAWLPALYLIACGSLGNFGRFLQQPTGPIAGAPAGDSQSR